MVGRAENINESRNYQPRVRYVNGLTIYFRTKQSIYVTDNKVAIVLERWFESREFYSEQWHLLSKRLKNNKEIHSVYDVWNMAMRYEVQAHQTFRFPEVEPGTPEIKEVEK